MAREPGTVGSSGVRWGTVVLGGLMALVAFGISALISLNSSVSGEFPAFPYSIFMICNPLVYVPMVIMSMGFEPTPRPHKWIPLTRPGRVSMFIVSVLMAYASVCAIVLILIRNGPNEGAAASTVTLIVVVLMWFAANATVATGCLLGPSHLLDLSARVLGTVFGAFVGLVGLISLVVSTTGAVAEAYGAVRQAKWLIAFITLFLVARAVVVLRRRRSARDLQSL